MSKNELSIIGYACGSGMEDSHSKLGPETVKKSSYMTNLPLALHWETIIACETSHTKLQAVPTIAKACTQLANTVSELVKNKQRFLVVGGDHTSAIGTWTGVGKALKNKGKLGLLWIDAHFDSHTVETSHSKNVHGMPVAALLGYIDSHFANICTEETILPPENICFIGIRSYEIEEKNLLEKLGVKIFYMEEIHQRGLIPVFVDALAHIKKHTTAFGISIDLDAIDPKEAPGVSCRVSDGIKSKDLYQALNLISDDHQFIGAEIVEFNPMLDKQHQTEKVISELTSAMFLRGKNR